MTEQLPDDSPSRLPPEHPTDPPDEQEIKADQKPVCEAGDLSERAKITSPRVAHRLSA
jgi:hypothetical protein